MKYKASIIIPTYNKSSLLQLTLKSIEKQNINLKEIEVIVCDDGSNDDTKQVVENFNEILNIKYLYQEDRGFRAAKARNMGIKVANSELCIFIDTGILIGSNTIKEYMNTFKQNRESVIIGSVIGFDNLNSNKKEINKLLDINNLDESIEKLVQNNIKDSRESYYLKFGRDLSKWKAPWIIMWSGNVGISKKCLEEVGMFDENYNTWGGEDTDLAIALYRNNNKFILNEACASIDTPHDKQHLMEKNPVKFQKEFLNKLQYMHKKYNDISTKLAIYYDYWYLNELLNIE